jgi:hypothetical protein
MVEMRRMRFGVALKAGFLLVLFTLPMPALAAQQSNTYGPEVKSFLELMRHEDDELEYQIHHNEISRPDYVKSKNRIAVHRQTVLNLVKESGADVVPELEVVTAAELDQLIEQGARALRGAKRGTVINNKWLYIGNATKGQLFYIFERIHRNQ